jgi:hypothetical protein
MKKQNDLLVLPYSCCRNFGTYIQQKNSELDAPEIEKLISAYRLGKKQVVHAI